MSNDIMKNLNDMMATAELSVGDWNLLVNMLNMPSQAQSIVCAKLIEVLSLQIGPQVEKAKESLEAVQKAQEKKE